MSNWSIELRIVYEDLPDMVEVETRVLCGDWSARSRAYASADFFLKDVGALIEWTANPSGTVQLEAGADTGIGWLVLEFYPIDAAGHLRCAVTLATGGTARDARPAETWRFAVELPTELGLVERFARECVSLGQNLSGIARLSCVPC